MSPIAKMFRWAAIAVTLWVFVVFPWTKVYENYKRNEEEKKELQSFMDYLRNSV